MKKIILLIAVFAGFYSSAQIEEVRVRTSKNFDQNASITVESSSFSAEFSGKLEDALWDAGYEIISERVARDIVQLESKGSDYINNTQTLSSSREIKSVYLITSNGRDSDVKEKKGRGLGTAGKIVGTVLIGPAALLIPGGKKGFNIKQITFNIIDLRDGGAIVAKISYNGRRKIHVDDFLDKVVEGLNK